MSSPAMQSIADLFPNLDRLGAEKLGLFSDVLVDWLHMPVVLCHHHRNLGVMLRAKITSQQLRPGSVVDVPAVGPLSATVAAVEDGVSLDMQQLSDALTSLCGGGVGICSSAAQLAVQASTTHCAVSMKLNRAEHLYAASLANRAIAERCLASASI